MCCNVLLYEGGIYFVQGYYLRIHGNYLRVVSNQRIMVAHSGLLRNGRGKSKEEREKGGVVAHTYQKMAF